MSEQKPSEAICPVCGYCCLGKGGFGCIDKPNLVNKEASPETKLIASQFQVKALRETLESLRQFAQQTGTVWLLKDTVNAISQPADTAEADALLARVKELKNQRDQWRLKHDVACDTITRMQYERKERHKHCVKADDYVQATAEAADEFNRHHEDMLRIIEAKDVQLTEARAVIDAAEKVITSLIPIGQVWAKLGPAGVNLAIQTLARIRERKGNRK